MVDVAPNSPSILGFELSVSARDDGAIEAAYVRFRDEPVSKTREIIEGTLLADYAATGELIGIEVLGPVRMSDLEALVDSARRATFRAFLEKTAPREFIAA